ncbi:hypothetical protein C7M71_011450 [Peterkaempfera bronchialis]|uniref:Uncharacterized protein n=2 Tax=Peterkaempfera bronchialis TaxID=2126346 RepID=A0A345T5T4_9ACTN|nr:DUF5691 domain-containing protein [Peterkaempfera bronchialis]AXI81339.1 hypothetical protein C7M71_011450 [Peterkaempfera bronchialis]
MTAPQTQQTGQTQQADAWEALVATALLGTDRRPVPGLTGTPALAGAAAAVDRSDPAAALLAVAALSTVHRRAGLRPATAPAPASAPPNPTPEPASDDPRPPLPEPARRRLGMLLADRSASAAAAATAGTAANLAELLPQWLGAARARGFRAPAPLLPALLDAARARSELRPDAVALAGPLGRWLAERNPDWRFVLRTVPEATAADGGQPPDGDAIWHEGLFAERVTHLTRLRRRDPAAALDLLRSTWSTERAEDRLLFLDALQERLTAADEPFLEAALGDRSKNVRLTAAELLSTLPGSALAARMADRARAAVRLRRGPTGEVFAVEPPAVCDEAMQRDGIALTSPTGRGERAWWLGEILAAAPLSLWTRETGRSPELLLTLPVADGWGDDLREAWARAAVRQHDAGWARALLGPPPRPGGRGGGRASGAPAKLLAVLEPEERAAWTAAFVEVHGLGEAFQMLGACAVPWSPRLGAAVVGALERAAGSGAYPWSHSGVLGMAERALAPEDADRVAALASAAEGGAAWTETFTRLAGTLRFRAAMLAELG